jgi:GT2 family glycosyltransferase
MSSVDVVVPCYNYAHYLPGCVASILSQRDVDVRVLIVDDQSPDNTAEVGQALAAADPRVIYTRNEKNLRLIGTSNRGVIEWARADYVLLLSADDGLTPGALARATKLMDANPDVGLTWGLAQIMGEGAALPQPADVGEAETRVLDGMDFIKSLFARGNFIFTPTAIVRTSVQHAVGGYDAAFPYTSDLDMWLRIGARGKVGVINAPQGLYRIHASNLSHQWQRGPLGDRRVVAETLTHFVNGHVTQLPALAALLSEKRRLIGHEALAVANWTYAVDDAAHADALALANELLGDLRKQPAWWRLQLKKTLGAGATHALRRAKAALPTQSGSEHYAAGDIAGWWPDTA